MWLGALALAVQLTNLKIPSKVLFTSLICALFIKRKGFTSNDMVHGPVSHIPDHKSIAGHEGKANLND